MVIEEPDIVPTYDYLACYYQITVTFIHDTQPTPEETEEQVAVIPHV